MTAVITALLVWLVVSLPAALFFGRACRVGDFRLPTLEGIDGSYAVYRHGDGRLERVFICAPINPVA